jgi:hypothetical protein
LGKGFVIEKTCKTAYASMWKTFFEDFINRKFHEFEVKSLVVYSTFFNSTQHFPKIAIEGICCSFSKVIQKDTRHRESLHQKLQAK